MLTKPGCGNCFYLSPKIGSKGPEDSKFVIVGESPGIQEIVAGKPFVGPSGEVIHSTLEKMGGGGLTPFFTNAISCLPRQKDPQNVAAACQRCRPRLFDELRKHPRTVILALGATALQSLTGDFNLKITRERGKLFRSELASIGIVASVHPSFLLRGGGNYTQFERDVKYAIDLVREGESARKLPSGTTYEVLDKKDSVQDFISLLKSEPPETRIGSDIETTGFNHQTDRILYLGLQHRPHKSVIIPGHLLTNDIFQPHLDFVWHNGKFDCRFLRPHFKDARVDNDTMLMSYALNERRGIHDLDQAASDWLGSVNHKHLVDYIYKANIIDQQTGEKRKGNLGDLEPELVQRYLALDINDTYHLVDSYWPQIAQDKKLLSFYNNHLIPGSEYLLKLELNGLMVDDEWVERNHYRLTEEIYNIEQRLTKIANKYGLTTFNPGSWQQVKDLFYTKMKLAPYSWATDDDTLAKLQKQYPRNSAIVLLREHRKVAKSHGTYVKPLIWGEKRDLLVRTKQGKPSKKPSAVFPDGRTHSSYLLHGTPTSRLACRDPNVQNIPRDPMLRGQFRARDGYGILECDYSQAELRCLAALSGCPDLGGIFLAGKDLHNEFTTFLFGPGWTKENKMAAKTVNFGIPYGREAPSIAADPDLNKNREPGNEITVEEAQGWIDGWSQRFPVAWDFIQKCRQAPALNQTITTVFGNKKRPGVVSQDKLRDLMNESANFPHQSTASNLTMRAGMELIDPLEQLYDTYIVNTVHDCLVMEIPLNMPLIREVATIVMNKMEEIATRYPLLKNIPFKADAEFMHRWGNAYKLKDMWDQPTCYLHSLPKYVPAH